MVLNCVALDRIFHALSDPTRRFIVDDLSDGEASATQLLEPHPMELPTLLKHLKVLERAGLIRTQKIGRVRTCYIEPQAFRTLDEWVTFRRRVWDHRLRRG